MVWRHYLFSLDYWGLSPVTARDMVPKKNLTKSQRHSVKVLKGCLFDLPFLFLLVGGWCLRSMLVRTLEQERLIAMSEMSFQSLVGVCDWFCKFASSDIVYSAVYLHSSCWEITNNLFCFKIIRIQYLIYIWILITYCGGHQGCDCNWQP